MEIYGLYDPRDGALRYVGKAVDSVKRLGYHLREFRRSTPVYVWIAELRALGLHPSMQVLLVCEDFRWEAEERRLIVEHRAAGADLLNVAVGGKAPFCPRDVRAENGRKNSVARVSTPFKRRVYELNRNMAGALRRGEVSEKIKTSLRYAVAKRPDLFGGLAKWL